MSVSAARAPRIPPSVSSHIWWILLLIALGVLWFATARRIERVEALTNFPTWSVDAPAADASSPTGFAQGQRRLVVPGHHSPSFWWIMEAQLAAEQGRLRLRQVDYDAVPEGRSVRRTAPYRWWLTAVGWLRAAATGEPLGAAIERGALFADPLLLALLLLGGAVYCARYLGAFAPVGFVIGGISLFPLAANFQPGAPDPHSLGWLLALGSVLPLLAAPEKVGVRRRIHFAAAGVSGGLGLWNDAATQAPLLLALFLGAAGYELARSRGERREVAAESNWRAWATAGALTTLAASLFEFAPVHFTWSLDSVSPIHALAWWGGGEILRGIGTWFRLGRAGFNPRSLALLVAAALAAAAWPVAGVWSDSGGLLASDFHALELANHPEAGFAPSLPLWLDRARAGAKWATLLPGVLLVVLLARIALGKIEREERGRLVFILAAAVFVLVLAHRQLRWWNLFDVLALVALAALFAGAGSKSAGWSRLAAVLLVVPGIFVGFPKAAGKNVTDILPREAQTLIARDFAYWLVQRRGAEPNVLFSAPFLSGAAAYYGGFKVVGSSDEGNDTGYQTAVRIASVTTVQELSVLLPSLGVTHVALPLWDPALDRLVRAGLALPDDQPLPQNAFVVALRQWDMPLWMYPMDYLIPNQPGFEGYELRAFALRSEQEPDLGLSRLADFFVQRGQLQEARAMRESLGAYPRSVVALGAVATIDLALRDRARLSASLEAVVSSLGRRSARDLPPDRRLSLATLFMQTNRIELARTQLTECFEELDAETLRTLTPSSVVSLLALSRSLDMPFPDSSLESLARELTPPGVRAQLTKK